MPLNALLISESWVLNWVYNFTIKHLEQGVFLNPKPTKELESWQWVVFSLHLIPTMNVFFFRKSNSMMFETLIETKWIRVMKFGLLSLKRVAKWPIFVLSRVRVEGLSGTPRPVQTSLEYLLLPQLLFVPSVMKSQGNLFINSSHVALIFICRYRLFLRNDSGEKEEVVEGVLR